MKNNMPVMAALQMDLYPIYGIKNTESMVWQHSLPRCIFALSAGLINNSLLMIKIN